MTELIVFLSLTLVLVGILALNRRRDSRRLRRRVREVISGRLWEELEQEREASQKRREKFQKALHQASGEKDSD